MRILVTGGTGVIGYEAVSELLRRGHEVRLHSRNAKKHAARWSGVEPVPGDITQRASIQGACDGCDAVLHIAGIVAEQRPALTFDTVNVGGTRNVVMEAEAARVRRFVYVSSLGADSGQSPYHRSKLAAESIVAASRMNWTIVRPGNVYGPGDDVISLLLKMMRALPAVPVVDGGDQKFQPVWHEDLARALANAVERDDLQQQTLEVAGNEQTTVNDLLERLTKITGRDPMHVPVPGVLASTAAAVAASARVPFPVDESKLQMLKEENILPGQNALDTALGVRPTPLDEGLRRLADEMPEQLPQEGVGSLAHKRFFARVTGSRMRASTLMTKFRESFSEIVPLDFETEPNATTEVAAGNTLTMSLPLRGNAQVRIEVVEPNRIVLVTVEGHPLAGAVQFTTLDNGGDVEFAIDTFTRSANVFDWIAMKTVGAPLQDANWKRVVQRVIDLSGGTSTDGVQSSARKLNDDEAREIEKRLRATVYARERAESAEDAAQR
jgi:NADH dehydrogenase